jgi:hypothetical protein
MPSTLLTLTLAALVPAGPPRFADRERHPLAPSLPLLTEKEQQAIERIIDRFIEYDTGKLKGAEGARALAEFNGLGREAIPALLDGLNRAATMEASCPAVLIAKKLARFLSTSEDPQLLDLARETIGAGVKARRHSVVLKDLKVTCQLRKSALLRAGLANKGDYGKGAGTRTKVPRSMTLAELSAASGSERGLRLKAVLSELETRKGPEVLEALGIAAGSYEKDVQRHARGLLDRHLARQTASGIKARLTHDRAEVRAAAARAVGARKLRYGTELIELLTDAEVEVRGAARQALVRLSGGQDYGPQPGASDEEVRTAVGRWRDWWAGQSRR